MGERDRRGPRRRRRRLLLPEARGRRARGSLRPGPGRDARQGIGRGALATAVVAWFLIVAAAPASAKGDLVQIGVSGGDLRREIRIPATNAEVLYVSTEAHMKALRGV